MIFFLKGVLTVKNPTWVEVDVCGVGYGLNISINTFDNLPDLNQEIFIYTHQYVREALIALYGFYSFEEKEMFLTLIKVSGIGPKVAISMLSALNESQIKQSIIREDAKLLSSIPGIGKKTAERIVVELKDKLVKKTKKLTNKGESLEVAQNNGFDDAVLALQTLGYSLKDSLKVVEKILKEYPDDMIEEIIRKSLQILIKQ